MTRSPTFRIGLVALMVLVLDQLTKQLVLRFLDPGQERVIIDGFFKFVHWGNTGAAWSMFNNNNRVLAIVAILALFVLYMSRHYFDAHTKFGQVALGLVFGGILGNLTDRIITQHVTDFLRFYLQQRGGQEIGFPAFNIADSAICIGVGFIFILSWKSGKPVSNSAQPSA